MPREHLFDDELSWEVPEEEYAQLLHQSYLARENEGESIRQNKRTGTDGSEPAMIPLMSQR